MSDALSAPLPDVRVARRGAAPTAAWYPPLGLPKLFGLLFLTSGTYVMFYMYRVARDLRDHADNSIKPWLYPLSCLTGFTNAIAGGRLAIAAHSITTAETHRESAHPGQIAVLLFVAHTTLFMAFLFGSVHWSIIGLLLFATPWLLLQRQMNALKAAWPNAAYVTTPNRFTKLQLVALIGGMLFWILQMLGG